MFKLLFILLLVSGQAIAGPQNHEIDTGKKVTVDVPSGWEAVKDLFGIPLTILGPWENESRPVLTFLYTHLTTKKYSQQDFQTLFVDFKNEKDQWVKSHQGQLLSYEPATKIVFGKSLVGHFIGLEFFMNGIHFIERSYYLYCNEEVYNLKYSLRDEHRKYLPQLQKIVAEFKCQ